jgi:ABC-type Fe3+ transport system substrate-binding protein
MAKPDLIAYLPCPIKVPFEEAVGQFLHEQGISSLELEIEGNANKDTADYTALVHATTPAELPSLLITPGVNELFGGAFVSRVLDSGTYADAAPYPRNSHAANASLRDPLGNATVLAANITVLVIDDTHIGTRSRPGSWRDLIQDSFARSVIMRGNGRTFCETTLLAWQLLFGAEGLVSMGRSVKVGLHPAQMVKLAGTGSVEGAAVYVMPYFFARNIQRREQVEIVWPREGAIASPVTLLAKRELSPELRKLAEWLAGPIVAKLFARAGFATPHPQVESGLPAPGNYLWTGWERARSSDVAAELAAAEAAFASGHR